jgi:tetratricopeptide (TPR) repeat protein
MDYEGMLMKINLLYKQKKYKEVEEKIYSLINNIKSKNKIIETDNHYLWFCHVKLANCERRKDNYEQAIDMAKKALLYCTIESEKLECYWIMGICNKYIDEISIALECYDKCIDGYSRTEDIERLVKVLKCKALMLHDEILLMDAIDLLKKSKNTDLALLEDLKKTLNEMKIYNDKEEHTDISNVISLDTYKALHNKQ